MADYLHAEDGKVHTRYTELCRCTPGQIDRVLMEREGLSKRFKSESLDFGTDRHDMWEEESKKTGLIPACFGLEWPVSHVETEFASEILPGIVLHSRPDSVCQAIATLVDYKTIIADTAAEGALLAVQRYLHSKQLLVYAYQLGLHGIKINRIAYLVEIWNREQDEILGYKNIIKPLKMAEIATVLPWVKSRVSVLAAGLESAYE